MYGYGPMREARKSQFKLHYNLAQKSRAHFLMRSAVIPGNHGTSQPDLDRIPKTRDLTVMGMTSEVPMGRPMSR